MYLYLIKLSNKKTFLFLERSRLIDRYVAKLGNKKPIIYISGFFFFVRGDSNFAILDFAQTSPFAHQIPALNMAKNHFGTNLFDGKLLFTSGNNVDINLLNFIRKYNRSDSLVTNNDILNLVYHNKLLLQQSSYESLFLRNNLNLKQLQLPITNFDLDHIREKCVDSGILINNEPFKVVEIPNWYTFHETSSGLGNDTVVTKLVYDLELAERLAEFFVSKNVARWSLESLITQEAKLYDQKTWLSLFHNNGNKFIFNMEGVLPMHFRFSVNKLHEVIRFCNLLNHNALPNKPKIEALGGKINSGKTFDFLVIDETGNKRLIDLKVLSLGKNPGQIIKKTSKFFEKNNLLNEDIIFESGNNIKTSLIFDISSIPNKGNLLSNLTKSCINIASTHNNLIGENILLNTIQQPIFKRPSQDLLNLLNENEKIVNSTSDKKQTKQLLNFESTEFDEAINFILTNNNDGS